MNSQQTQEANWRDQVLNESARGFNYENHVQAFMVALRGFQPDWATVTVDASRARAIEFLRSQCQNARSLIRDSHTDLNERRKAKEEVPSAIWYAVEWENHQFEVAFVFLNYLDSAICLSSEGASEHLSRFARTLRDFCARPKGRSLSFAQGTWEDSPQIDQEIGKVTWDDITLPATTLRELKEAVEGFFSHREAMKSFGFAWKRGILLVGPPGTGKTMVCKAIAAQTPGFPFLYVRNFDGHHAIPNVFTRARALSPCIVAFEDIDGLLEGQNRTIFLNEMDGFASNEGLFIIASSNHPGKIDEALLKRPSRFDRVFHLGLPELAERRIFCEKILTNSALGQHLATDFDTAGLIEMVAAKTDGFTPAYLKEAFTAAALTCAQEGIMTLDKRFHDAVLRHVDELKSHLKKVKNPDSMAEMRSSDDTIGFRR